MGRLPIIQVLYAMVVLPLIARGNNSASYQQQPQGQYKQWFTGALLTPTPTTLPPGRPVLELVAVATDNYGYYDSHWRLKHTPHIYSLASYFDFQAGFNERLGIEVIGSVISNFSQAQSYIHIQDTIMRLGFQISTDKRDSWLPDFRILLQEDIPTGKYKRLNPRKKKTDLTGEGSFQTGVHLVVQKLFNEGGRHPFSLRGDLGYLVPSAVHIKGLSYYGGNIRTKGVVYPGKSLVAYLFGELSLSRTWALAIEMNYQHGERGKFSGKEGKAVNIYSYDEFSIFPEIQHTYSENLGIVLGSWFTVAGKNVVANRNLVCAVLFLF